MTKTFSRSVWQHNHLVFFYLVVAMDHSGQMKIRSQNKHSTYEVWDGYQPRQDQSDDNEWNRKNDG